MMPLDRAITGLAGGLAHRAPPRWRATNNDCPGESGFVLVVVLLALALMALVAMGLTRTVALDIKLKANLARHAEAEALADGIARLVTHHLVVNRPERGRSEPFRLDGIPLRCRIGDSVATITILDAAGQIDLNAAPRDLLQRVLLGVDLPADQAIQLATAIVRFRGAGTQTPGGGGEADSYRQAGLPYGPKNAAFESVGELDQVLGMSPVVLARLRSLVTVHSQMRIVDPSVASLPVLLALSGDNRAASVVADADALDALRTTVQLPAELTTLPQTRSTSSRSNAARTFAIRAGIRHAGRTQFIRETVISLVPRLQSGFVVKEWSRLDPDQDIGRDADTGAAPACLGAVLLN